MPCAASRSSTSASASWLFAAPQIARQRSRSTESALEHRAERARSEDVAVLVEDPVGRDGIGAERVGDLTRRFFVQVGDDHRRAGLGEHLDEVRPHVPGPLHGDAPTVERRSNRRASRRPARIAEATPNAVTGDGSPEPPRAGSTPVTHGVSSANVSMSAGVAPTSSAAMYRPPSSSMARPIARNSSSECGASGVVDEHHCLSAALVQPGDGRLERHRLGQAERVDDRVVLVGVVPEADAAERRAEHRRVDRDDRAEPGRRRRRRTRPARDRAAAISSVTASRSPQCRR